jgi:hypothetical protein
MTNLFGAFTAEVYRTLATQIIPGLVAISTWLIVLCRWSIDFRGFIEHHSSEASVCIALAAIFFGQVCEDVGSDLEVRHCERCYPDENEREKREQEWWAYLRTAFQAEPVGQRYLRTLVLRLKFECNAPSGLVLGAFGLFFIADVSRYLTIGIAVIMLLFAYYLGWIEAPKTVRVLADVRRELLKHIRIVQ